MTTNIRYSAKDSQHLLFQFLSRNIAIKPGHKLPKEFGDSIRVEIDKTNRKEINLLLIKGNNVRRLNRANIPSKISIHRSGVMELIFHFTEIGFGAEPPFDQYQFTFKLSLHFSLTGTSAAFLFLVEPIEKHLPPDEIYLGRLLLQPNIIHLHTKNKNYKVVG